MVDNVNVNVAPAPTPQWVNADGLRVKFGSKEAEQSVGGEYKTYGAQRCSELFIDWNVMALGTDATHNVIFDYDVVIPTGAIIERAEFWVTEEWTSAGDAATLNFGLLSKPAAGSTAYVIVDADGIFAAIAETVIDLIGNMVEGQAAGGYINQTTYSGADLGQVTAAESVVCGHWLTAVPTGGAGYLRLFWSPLTRTAL
jgi:hypothetical protein